MFFTLLKPDFNFSVIFHLLSKILSFDKELSQALDFQKANITQNLTLVQANTKKSRLADLISQFYCQLSNS